MQKSPFVDGCQTCCQSRLLHAGNPHYTPEVSTKVMIVNFAVKQQGLEAQLLNTVVKQERADLDRQKNELVVKVAQGKRTQVSKPFVSFVSLFLFMSSVISSVSSTLWPATSSTVQACVASAACASGLQQDSACQADLAYTYL